MNARLIVNDFELDLSSSIPIPLNYSIADIKDPQKRKRSFSKSIVLEGTQNNLNYFISAYELSLSVGKSDNINFRPNEKQSCKYYKDDLLIFSGKFKLNEVKIINNEYTFDCTLYSDTVDYFAKLKDKKLSELNWDEYQHPLTRPNVINSWSTSILKNNNVTRNFGADSKGYQPKGFGYVYPLIDYGYSKLNDTSFKITDIAPFVYVKECVQKIFDYALEGTKYTVDLSSGVFTNPNFVKLIYGFGGGEKIKLSADTIQKMRVTKIGTTDNVTVKMNRGPYYQNPPYKGYDYSISNSYNPLNVFGIFNQTSITENINKTNAFGLTSINSSGKYTLNIQGDFRFKTDVTIVGQTNGAITLNYSLNSASPVIIKQIPFVITNTYTTFSINETIELDLKANDNINLLFKIFASLRSEATTANLIYEWQSLTYDLQAKDGVIVDNTIIDISTFLPDIKCADFLTGIMNMFYLYVSDPIENVITIGTLEDFYKGESDAEDWTDKIDDNKEIVIQSNAFVDGSNYIFRYNEEKDFFNNQYLNLTSISYGSYEQKVDTWQTGERVWQIPFSQFVPIEIKNSTMKLVYIREQDQTGSVKPYKGKGMIMYYNGLRPGKNSLYNALGTLATQNTDYPFIHHFRFAENQTYDNPLFDIHFASRNATFDGIKKYPSINLFNKYHYKFINEITSIDSKLVNLYVKLTNKDINEIDFSKLKKINAVLYRLNAVKDFDSDAFESTEIELLKYLR